MAGLAISTAMLVFDSSELRMQEYCGITSAALTECEDALETGFYPTYLRLRITRPQRSRVPGRVVSLLPLLVLSAASWP